MNKVFLIGKIVSEICFKFIIESKHISIVVFEIETLKGKQKIPIKAYDKNADLVYSRYKKGDYVLIYGRIEKNGVQVSKVEKF